jgi:predicted GIY-YIG superfamily endonuclease
LNLGRSAKNDKRASARSEAHFFGKLSTTEQKDQLNGIYLYILTLSNGKYYVGITNNPEQRFETHRSGESVTFVNKNLPIISIEKKLLKTTNRFEAERIETKKTLSLIRKHGIANVCGG